MKGPTDFNDLQLAAGTDAVRAQLEKAKSQTIVTDKNTVRVEIPDEPILSPEMAHQLHEQAEAIRQGNGGAEQELPPAEAYTTYEAGAGSWHDELLRSESGGIKNFVSNVVLILRNDPVFRDGLSYCDFSYRVMKRRALLPHMRPGEWNDDDTAHLMNWLGACHQFNPSVQHVVDALVVVSQGNRFHPVQDYLNSLVWDGLARLDTWLEDIFDAVVKDPEGGGSNYLAMAGRFFLIGAVARVMRQPRKMDNVIIFEGEQGEGKSTALNVLFGDWFSDSPVPIGDKDAYQIMQGMWCCELAELDSFNKAESTSAKQFFSSMKDRYRPSYGRMAKDFYRQTVFAGTTNQDEYLKDYTGNRRYWPIYCRTVNIRALLHVRDQLWAEAMHYHNKAGDKPDRDRDDDERWWPDKDEKLVFIREQDARLQVDPWQTKIEDYLYKITTDYVTSLELLEEAIKRDAAHITRADQNRIGPIMHKLGWRHTKKRIPLEGSLKPVPRNVYVRPDDWKRVPVDDKGGDDEPIF